MAKKRRKAKSVAAVAPPAPRSAPSRPKAPVRNPALERLVVRVALALGAVVAACHLRAVGGQFMNWDDPTYVTNNRDIQTLSWRTVEWAFTTFHAGNWHPVTWLSLALDHAIFGLRPSGYHLTSVVLHVANSVLVLVVFHRLTGALWRSAAVAALFGLHPLHVESVAWVAERKDVLSAFFWLLTMGAYLRWVQMRRWSDYAAVMLLYALALLSKPMAITLPFVLLLLDWWPLGRLSRAAVVEKIPLLLVAAGQSISTFVAQAAGGAVGIDPIPLGARFANATVAYVRYLALTFWPVGLSPWYSHPALEGPPLRAATVIGSAALLVAITAGVVLAAKRRPWAAVGWLWWLGTLVPVIGIVQVGRQAMADRYTYIPHLGLFVMVAWALAELPVWKERRARLAATAAATAVLASLGVLTYRQIGIWHDPLTFWTYTARMAPYSFVAHQGLGGLLFHAGRNEEAVREYRLAAHLRPGIADVHSRLGTLFVRTGRLGPAAAQFRKAVAARQPASANDLNSLADVLIAQGRPVQARRQVARALALQPRSPEAHNNLGRVLVAEGRLDEAEAEFRAALRERRPYPAAERNLADVLERRRAGMSSE